MEFAQYLIQAVKTHQEEPSILIFRKKWNDKGPDAMKRSVFLLATSDHQPDPQFPDDLSPDHSRHHCLEELGCQRAGHRLHDQHPCAARFRECGGHGGADLAAAAPSNGGGGARAGFYLDTRRLALVRRPMDVASRLLAQADAPLLAWTPLSITPPAAFHNIVTR